MRGQRLRRGRRTCYGACMGIVNRWATFEPYLRSVLRIVAGLLFSFHGYQKFFGWFGGMGGAPAPLASQFGVAGVLETFGGAMIILGLFTRPVAFILSGQMAVAYFMAHMPRGTTPLLNGGELAIFYCFTYLWLSAAGAGPWSIDALRGRK